MTYRQWLATWHWRPLSLTITDTAPRRNRDSNQFESSWIIQAGNTRRNSRFRAFLAKLVCGASHVETLVFSQPWSTLADFFRRIGEPWHVWGYIAKNDPKQRVLQNRYGACGDTRNLGHQALVRHGKWKNSAAGNWYPFFLCNSMGTQIPDLFNCHVNIGCIS